MATSLAHSRSLSNILTPSFISGALLTLTGILFCAFRAQLISVLLTIVGVLLIVLGAISLIRHKYAEGATEVAVGIIIIACGWTVVDITLLILGICFIAYAVYSVISSLHLLKKAKLKDKLLTLANPILLTIFGILLIVARWYMIDALFIVGGVLAILSGVTRMIKSCSKSKSQIDD